RPLRDAYHFGQTIINDNGRPYGEGFNSLAGVTAHAVAGPLSFDIQGEYQHAPGTPSDPPGALQAIAAVDATLPFGNGISQVNGDTLLGPGNINPQPYLHGFKFSFKPTENLEFGMGVTAQFVGPGLPFTWHNFLRTYFAHTSGANNPGKRISEFDFSYRFPGLRKWLTVYNDAMVVDEFSPIGSTRPTLNPGI